ncbi:site-specific integrase [Lentisphaerota bacterium WC36G]|nr:site-specific integrase [Lentisphaerae bacterium WC36]
MKLKKRNNVYWLDAYVNNKRIRKSTGMTVEADAKAWAKEYIDGLIGESNAKKVYETIKNNLVDKEVTFKEAIKLFLDYPRKQQPSKNRVRVIKSAWSDFTSFCNNENILYPHLVTEDIAINYFNHLKKYGRYSVNFAKKQLSNKTINDIIATIKMIMSFLKSRNLLIEDPFINIKNLDKNTVNREAYTEDELKIMGELSKGTYLYDIILTGVFTGLRLGDIAHLKWKIIDLENMWIGDGSQDAKQRKTNNDINLPIVPALAHHLLSLEKTSDYVYPELQAKYAGGQDAISTDFKKLLDNCEIVHSIKIEGRTRKASIKDIHSLRHTFAYIAAISNIPLPIVQGVLGHMTTDMTKHYMNHASKKDKAKHLSKLPNYLADCEVLPAVQNANCSFDVDEVKNLIENMNSENWQINRFKLLELLK